MAIGANYIRHGGGCGRSGNKFSAIPVCHNFCFIYMSNSVSVNEFLASLPLWLSIFLSLNHVHSVYYIAD